MLRKKHGLEKFYAKCGRGGEKTPTTETRRHGGKRFCRRSTQKDADPGAMGCRHFRSALICVSQRLFFSPCLRVSVVGFFITCRFPRHLPTRLGALSCKLHAPILLWFALRCRFLRTIRVGRDRRAFWYAGRCVPPPFERSP